MLIVDDHPLVRNSLRRALADAGFLVIGEAPDGDHAVKLALRHRPDVVLMDLCLPEGSGLQATKSIARSCPSTAVVILTMLSDAAAARAAKEAGARAFLNKDADLAEIVDTTRQLADSRGAISCWSDGSPPNYPSFGHDGAAAAERPSGRRVGGAAISKREEEVLRLLATGISAVEAARTLCISGKTLKNHLGAIYRKLDVHDRSQAVLRAVRIGIIDIS